jgi:predicted dehydrogenase
MALESMRAGKHLGVEVPAATTIEDCWKLVDTSERTRRHCMIMENCCYGAAELLVLNMVRAGIFGELIYGEAAYLHDLRAELFSNEGEGLWRRFPHLKRNGNLYPTTDWGRSPTTWESIAATGSTIPCQEEFDA